MKTERLFDAYTLRARGFPIFMLSIPLFSAMVPWMGSLNLDLPTKIIGGGIIASLGAFLLNMGGQISRQMGRAAEAKLREKWRDHRTGKFLRWRDGEFGESQKARMHANLASLAGIPAPTREEEQSDPTHADEVYTQYAEMLRAYALSRKSEERFAATNEERANYGMIRNFYGLRHVMWILIGLAFASFASAIPLDNNVNLLAWIALTISALITGYLARASVVKARSDDFARQLLLTAMEPLSATPRPARRKRLRSSARVL